MSKSADGVHGTPYIWIFLVALFAGSPALGAQSETASGELQIDGGPIERLILLDENGRQKHFDRPGESLPLPPGVYRLHEVALEGGYVCRAHRVPGDGKIVVEPGRPATLRLGAPLRQTIRVERWGTRMILNYDLLGRGGERYCVPEDSAPPAFAVFRGDRAILSGSLRRELGDVCSYRWRVPLRMSGVLRVVSTYDLGTLGPDEGEPTLCAWRWFYCIPGLPLWMVLLATAVVPRAGRTPRTLLILLPVILVYAGWSALAGTLPSGPLEHETSRIMILSLAAGLAVLWLVARPVAGGTRGRGLLGALVVAVGIVFLGAASLSVRFSDQMVRFISVLSVLMSAATFGHVLSRRSYSRRRRTWRFVLSLAVWTFAASIASMFLMIATWCTAYGGWLGDADYILWLTFLVAPSLGAGVFAMSLLFAIIGLRTGFSTEIPLRT